MKKILLLVLMLFALYANAQERRPVDSQHPMWLVHVDVWNKADPQKIINLIPEKIKPYVVMNLSLSCQYDKEKNVYKMPQNAIKTYKSWGTVCQQNGMWFTCQPASGGHTHIQDDDLETFEYMFKTFPNFLGWNYAEQFWGFDEAGDKSSSSQTSRIALFAKLVEMSHKYGGFLTISFCGNIWSHPLNPIGMMKRNTSLQAACKKYPEAILWLYKYTTSSCFYNNESVTWSPFVAGYAKNYGVRYDNCGWNGALDALLGEGHGKKYPNAAGFGTVMEQTCVNGGAVWDGPELIWTEDFQNLSNSTVDGYTRRNWGIFPGFKNGWLDMFDKIIDGTMYIPTREEIVNKTKIYVINNVTSGNDEQKYAAWGDLYDGLYKQSDPFNRGNGQWMDNFCYFKKTGRYGAIPVGLVPYDDLAKTIPVKIYKSTYSSRWGTTQAKVNEFDKYYPVVSKGDLYVNRFKNQLVTYTPYTYMNSKKSASADIPLMYNTCDTLRLVYGKLSSGIVHEYADHIDFYLNNYRSDTTTVQTDLISVIGATTEPTFKFTKRAAGTAAVSGSLNAETGVYTLTVKHNGPVDITLNCSGAGIDRQTDVVPNTTLELPKQPAEYNGPITIEAEDMDYKSIKSCVTDPYGWYPTVRGHAGNGFMDMGTNTSGALKHQIKIKHAGDYRISVRYTNTAKAGNLEMNVNGTKTALRCEKTATNVWTKATLNTTLNEGLNTLIITNAAGIAMYIDNVTYCPAEVEDEKFGIVIRDTEHGKVIAEVDSASEGETIALTVIPDEGYKLKTWNVKHGGVVLSTTGDISFVMPDDNVVLEPVFEDMTMVYTLDYTNVLAGTLPPGWQCTQGSNEVHSYPNSYSSGARTFSGFGGYQGKGLYWREVKAEYGRQTNYLLTLNPGKYVLKYAMAAWKGTPSYKVSILDSSNKTVTSTDNFTATPNVNGNTGASVASAVLRELPFDITTKGNYIISFTDPIGGFEEYLLLKCDVCTVPEETAIEPAIADNLSPEGVFTIQGVKVPNLKPGLNIVKTRNGAVKKVFVR